MSNVPEGIDLSEDDLEVIRVTAVHFDAAYYLAQNPDVERAEIDAVLHYTVWGWREMRNPTPEFSTSGYLQQNPDVAETGANPFWHYHTIGKAEGRVWQAPEVPPAAEEPAEPEVEQPNPADVRLTEEAAVIRGAFDAAFYLRHNPDVVQDGGDPVTHFVTFGWKEYRDPSPEFSVRYYLEANPDVRASGLNPFWHYVVAGRDEGRLARHPGGYRAEMLINTMPLEKTVQAWRWRTPPEAELSAAELCHRVRQSARGPDAGLLLSVGHDNYREVPGGVQYCIQHEEETARAHGWVYLNLHPHQPLPRLVHEAETDDTLVTLVLSGQTIGAARMSVLAQATRAFAGDFRQVEVVIHHLMGHSTEQLLDLARAAGTRRCWMWLHDFFTLCPSFALQRNNVTYCAAPPEGSNACRLCLYGEERVSHGIRMADFFGHLAVHVIAPSRFAADFWTQHTGLTPAALTVCEHMQIGWSERPKKARAGSGPVTVAFVGSPAPHKGWSVFERLVRENGGRGNRHRFVYFGSAPVGTEGVESVAVTVTAEDPDAMIRALVDRNVDIVVHWANWGETFSFSTYEALAAGAWVLTNPISGNVAATVRRTGCGAVLESEADLVAFFSDGQSQAMARAARDRRRTHQPSWTRSAMTMPLLLGEPPQ